MTDKNSENDNNLRRSSRLKDKPHFSYTDNDLIYDYILYRAESAANDIPQCFQDIDKSPEKGRWMPAIEEELMSPDINKTWILVEKPRDKNIVDCK